MKSYRFVDLDGTLAFYNDKWDGSIGKPVPLMLQQVKDWLAAGDEVIIFTARVALRPDLYADASQYYADQYFALAQKRAIEKWCLENLGVVLEVTAQKDHRATHYYDDRAWHVEKNTGKIFIDE